MPYIGEIRMFAGNFAPSGWALCQGQTMAIDENDVLFALIGTTYGGDGQQTFNLPDLQGRVPVHMGKGPALTQTYVIGEKAGVESVTLSVQQIPAHSHAVLASTAGGSDADPQDNVLATPPSVTMYIADTPGQTLAAASLLPVGGSQPHDNLMPVLGINFIICLYGVFPTQ